MYSRKLQEFQEEISVYKLVGPLKMIKLPYTAMRAIPAEAQETPAGKLSTWTPGLKHVQGIVSMDKLKDLCPLVLGASP